MTLKFVTGNNNKFEEAISILKIDLEQFKIKIKEIQELDAQKVIEAKLLEATKYEKGEFFCEDTSLYIDSMSGFPGPLSDWYLKCVGSEGIFKQVKALMNRRAYVKTIIGYCNGNEIEFFESKVKGEIVQPRGTNGFGWDNVFKPDGSEKTFAQMEFKEKNEKSMRNEAYSKFKSFLENKERAQMPQTPDIE